VLQDQDKPEAMVAQAGLDADGLVRAALAALGRAGVAETGARA
jgi:1-deoxy-D-xylulose-5-phosphate synthase